MKKITLSLLVFVTSFCGFSQGWIGNSFTSTIYPVNSSGNLTPLNVGIGTNTPQAQFHTTGTLRFGGLTQDNTRSRILSVDDLGNVFWRDASTIGNNGNFWSLTGNAITNPANDFLGTTNNNRLAIRTNNIERMTILPTNGNVGIGNVNPQALLHVSSSIGTMQYPYETFVSERNGDLKLGAYNSSTVVSNTAGGAAIAFGFSGQLVNGSYRGYEIQYGCQSAQPTGSADFWLRFNSLNRNAAGNVVGSNPNELVISNGNVGIALGTIQGAPQLSPVLPTTRLHVNCIGNTGAGANNTGVRLVGLPVVAGQVLTIDPQGNVGVSGRLVGRPSDEIVLDEQVKNLNKLQQQVAELQMQVKALLENLNYATSSKVEQQNTNTLEVVPTPFNSNAKVIYSISDYQQGTILQVIDISGKILKTFPVRESRGQIEIGSLQASSTTVIFNIINQGRLLISKKSISLN
jgi:hypothetical protein